MTQSLSDSAGCRILALVTDAFGGHGGIAQYNRDLLTSLAGLASITHVTILPRSAEVSDTMPAEQLTQLPPAQRRPSYALSALGLVLRRKAFDVVFCGHLHMAPLAAIVARLLRAPLWLQVHGIEAWRRPSHWQRWAVEESRLVTAVSRYTRRQFLQWARIEPAKVRVLPNTFSKRFTPGRKRADLLERHQLSSGKLLLTVSRLAAGERYKGQDRVIEALPRVLAKHAETIYVIVGDGDDQPRLERLAAERGVLPAVRFLGRTAEKDLVDYYRLADVFVMPSTGEGFGIVFTEAAACGLPVIAGNRDGSVDALADGAIGTLIAPNQEGDLAGAICAALNGTARSDPLRASRFSKDNFNAHVNELVRNLC